jgi:hypothetical protein
MIMALPLSLTKPRAGLPVQEDGSPRGGAFETAAYPRAANHHQHRHHQRIAMATIVYETTQLTPEHIGRWRGEPGVGVQHFDNVLKQDPEARILQMIVDGVPVACVVIKRQGGGCVVDFLVKKTSRGQGYGKAVAEHGMRMLLHTDRVEFVQLNVICTGKDRTALAKMIRHCTATIGGIVCGPTRGMDTWMLARAVQRQLTLDAALPEHAARADELAAAASPAPAAEMVQTTLGDFAATAAPAAPAAAPQLPWWAQ